MKRIFAILCVLLGILWTFPLFAHADSSRTEEDSEKEFMRKMSSSNIDKYVLNALEPDMADSVVRVYNTSVHSAFNTYDTIEDVMNSDYADASFYAVWYHGVLLIYTERFGLHDSDDTMFDRDVLPLYFSGEIIQKISPDIQVHNVYYLSGATNHEGTALYYQTDMGDYAYYSAHGGLLMPGTVFFDLMKSHKPRTWGPPTVNLTNYDVYKIDSDSFNPRFVVERPFETTNIAAVIDNIAECVFYAAIALGVFFLVRKNIKR